MKGADRNARQAPFSCLKAGTIPSRIRIRFPKGKSPFHGKLIYSSLSGSRMLSLVFQHFLSFSCHGIELSLGNHPAATIEC